jgi:hypothetical protein
MSEETYFCAECGKHHTGLEAWDHPTLSEREFKNRTNELLTEEMDEGRFEWWYLSFATDEGFLGGVYIQAFGSMSAVTTATVLGFNPGGEVACWGPIPVEQMDLHVPVEKRTRLLSKEEINE